MKNRRCDITWNDFGNMLIFIALPIAVQNLLTTTASMIDTIMIGSQGELSVAAVGICSQIGSLLFNLYWGFVSGAVLFLSQYWGADDHKGYNRVAGYTLVFAGGVGLFYGILNFGIPKFILELYTDKADIVSLAVPYMKIVGLSYPLQVFAAVFSIMLKSTERVKVPLASSVISLLVNFGVNFTLIYGRFGMPKMGITGAAIGTLLSSIVNVLILSCYLIIERRAMSLHINEIFNFDIQFTKNYLRKLFPVLMNEIFYGIGQMLINIVMGHQDESAIAAMAAFRVCEGFVYAFFGGLSNATSVVVGNQIGAGRLLKGYSYARRSAYVCPVITFTVVLLCYIFHNPLFTLFGLETQAIFYGKYMLLIFLFFGTIRTSCYIMNESFRAGGETGFGSIFEIGGLLFLTVPVTWVVGMVLKLPFILVFAFIYTDELLRLFVMTPYMMKGKWIKPMTEQGRKNLEEFRNIMKPHKNRKGQ